ncbi:hypothetical protein SAV31267_055650 [Streptomyces avermitilis]|uniref:Urease alpha-subunit N-terminal domain-containing protein n=1 Tax=Streptomyces avermitilis TaxID=33903 RepID=A0A4D4MV73_STRAX|nr:hypothetical protein SAV31267_055650 [Streptomyces avermitilis]
MLDHVIRGATVVDGTGAPAYTADVGIRDGRIAAVGTVTEPARAGEDAAGLVLAPASSTRTPTTTPSCSGTPTRPRPSTTG